jgi:hypothetical protein
VPKNKIEDLRDHLFETIERLKDDEKPMEIDRARAIADVARVIVESAKQEVAFLNAVGGSSSGTGFMATPEEPQRKLTAVSGQKR